jgi:outer membrane protein
MGSETTRWISRTVIACALMGASGAAYALDKGDVLLRVRAIDVVPNDSSSEVTPAGGTPVPGSEVAVNSAATLEADITYMFTSHIGLELIAATTSHTVTDNGVVVNALGLSGDVIGVTGVLPPTLTLQYHFLPTAEIRPYIGAGINYTVFYKESSGINGIALKIDNSVGPAAQLGLDWSINKMWFVNLDLKYIDMSSTATLSNATTGATAYTTDVKINPWVLGLGIGTTF